MAKNKAVFGIYPDRESLNEGLERARERGFRNTDLSVLFPENLGSKEFAHSKSTKAPEGVTAGAGSGAIIGGTLGWLAGIGTLAIPGIGPFIAAGPIMGLLAGIGAGGAVGGILGGLIGMGVPEYEAKRYEGRLRKGGILVSIHCDDSDWVEKAKEVLEQTGAEDISTTSEEKADFGASDKPLPRRTTAAAAVPGETRVRGDGALVRDFMTRDVATIDINRTLSEASAMMLDADVSLLVVTSEGDVVGVVTERGIVRATVAGHDPSQTSLRVALVQDYPYCLDHQPAADAGVIIGDGSIRHAVVLNDNRQVVGIVSADKLASPKASAARTVGRR